MKYVLHFYSYRKAYFQTVKMLNFFKIYVTSFPGKHTKFAPARINLKFLS